VKGKRWDVMTTRKGWDVMTKGMGKHTGTLNIAITRVVGDSVGSTGSYHGRSELGETRLHELARITMVSTMSRWPPMNGHPAMVVAIIVQL
jgi:hypothetical protein